MVYGLPNSTVANHINWHSKTPGLCTLDPTWLFVNLHLHHWLQRLCYLMHTVHLYMAVRSGVRCISTPIVNWMLHIMMPLDTCCMKLDGAARHNFSWPTMCLRLLPIFVNWCILCGDPWMLCTIVICMWKLRMTTSIINEDDDDASDNVLINAALRSDLLARSHVIRRWRNIILF